RRSDDGRRCDDTEGALHDPSRNGDPAPSRIGPGSTNRTATMRLSGGFREAKNISPRVLLDRHPVIHLVDAENLRIPVVASELVVLAHDQCLDRLGRAHLGTEAAKAAAGEVEVEVVED